MVFPSNNYINVKCVLPVNCLQLATENVSWHIGGLVQERCNSIANALELHLSCTNPSIHGQTSKWIWICQRLKHRQKHSEGILPKGPYLPCLRMADRALWAGYPRFLVQDYWAHELTCLVLGHQYYFGRTRWYHGCWWPGSVHLEDDHRPRYEICFNSLVPGRFGWNLRQEIFHLISTNHGWGISCEIDLRWFHWTSLMMFAHCFR